MGTNPIHYSMTFLLWSFLSISFSNAQRIPPIPFPPSATGPPPQQFGNAPLPPPSNFQGTAQQLAPAQSKGNPGRPPPTPLQLQPLSNSTAVGASVKQPEVPDENIKRVLLELSTLSTPSQMAETLARVVQRIGPQFFNNFDTRKDQGIPSWNGTQFPNMQSDGVKAMLLQSVRSSQLSNFDVWYLASVILKSIDDKLKPDYVFLMPAPLQRGIPAHNMSQILLGSVVVRPEVLRPLVEESTGMLISQKAVIAQRIRNRIGEPTIIRNMLSASDPSELLKLFSPRVIQRNVAALIKTILEMPEVGRFGITSIQAKLLPRNILSLWLTWVREQTHSSHWTADDILGRSPLGSTHELNFAILGLTCRDVSLIDTIDILPVIFQYRREVSSLSHFKPALSFSMNLRVCLLEKVVEYLKIKRDLSGNQTDSSRNVLALLNPGEIMGIGGEILSLIPVQTLQSLPPEIRMNIIEEIGSMNSLRLFSLVPLQNLKWYGNTLAQDLQNVQTQPQPPPFQTPIIRKGRQAENGTLTTSTNTTNTAINDTTVASSSDDSPFDDIGGRSAGDDEATVEDVSPSGQVIPPTIGGSKTNVKVPAIELNPESIQRLGNLLCYTDGISSGAWASSLLKGVLEVKSTLPGDKACCLSKDLRTQWFSLLQQAFGADITSWNELDLRTIGDLLIVLPEKDLNLISNDTLSKALRPILDRSGFNRKILVPGKPNEVRWVEECSERLVEEGPEFIEAYKRLMRKFVQSAQWIVNNVKTADEAGNNKGSLSRSRRWAEWKSPRKARQVNLNYGSGEIEYLPMPVQNVVQNPIVEYGQTSPVVYYQNQRFVPMQQNLIMGTPATSSQMGMGSQFQQQQTQAGGQFGSSGSQLGAQVQQQQGGVSQFIPVGSQSGNQFQQQQAQAGGQFGNAGSQTGAQVQQQGGQFTPVGSQTAQLQGQIGNQFGTSGSQFGSQGQQQAGQFAPMGSQVAQQQGQLGAQFGNGGSQFGSQGQQQAGQFTPLGSQVAQQQGQVGSQFGGSGSQTGVQAQQQAGQFTPAGSQVAQQQGQLGSQFGTSGSQFGAQGQQQAGQFTPVGSQVAQQQGQIGSQFGTGGSQLGVQDQQQADVGSGTAQIIPFGVAQAGNLAQQQGQSGTQFGGSGSQFGSQGQQQAGQFTPGASQVAQQQGQIGSQFGTSGSQFGAQGQQQAGQFTPAGSQVAQQQGQVGAQFGNGGSQFGAQGQQQAGQFSPAGSQVAQQQGQVGTQFGAGGSQFGAQGQQQAGQFIVPVGSVTGNQFQQEAQAGGQIGSGGSQTGAQVQQQAGQFAPMGSQVAQQQGQLGIQFGNGGSQFGAQGQQQAGQLSPIGSQSGQQQGQLGGQFGASGSQFGAQGQQQGGQFSPQTNGNQFQQQAQAGTQFSVSGSQTGAQVQQQFGNQFQQQAQAGGQFGNGGAQVQQQQGGGGISQFTPIMAVQTGNQPQSSYPTYVNYQNQRTMPMQYSYSEYPATTNGQMGLMGRSVQQQGQMGTQFGAGGNQFGSQGQQQQGGQFSPGGSQIIQQQGQMGAEFGDGGSQFGTQFQQQQGGMSQFSPLGSQSGNRFQQQQQLGQAGITSYGVYGNQYGYGYQQYQQQPGLQQGGNQFQGQVQSGGQFGTGGVTGSQFGATQQGQLGIQGTGQFAAGGNAGLQGRAQFGVGGGSQAGGQFGGATHFGGGLQNGGQLQGSGQFGTGGQFQAPGVLAIGQFNSNGQFEVGGGGSSSGGDQLLVGRSTESNNTSDGGSVSSIDGAQAELTCRGIRVAGPSAIGLTIEDLNKLTPIELFDCIEPLGILEWDEQSKKSILDLFAQKLFLTTDRLNTLTFIELGSLVTAIPVGNGEAATNASLDLSQLDLTLPESLDTLAVLGSKITDPTVLKILAEKFNKDNKIFLGFSRGTARPENLRITVMSLGNILCGFNDKIVHSLFESDASLFIDCSSTLGVLDGCPPEVLSTLATHAVKPSNYGQPRMWTLEDLETIGVVFAGLKPDLISSIPPESMQGLKPRAVKALPASSFMALTPQQISKMSYDAALSVHPFQTNSLSPAQAEALRRVIEVSNDEFDVTGLSDPSLQEETRSVPELESQGKGKADDSTLPAGRSRGDSGPTVIATDSTTTETPPSTESTTTEAPTTTTASTEAPVTTTTPTEQPAIDKPSGAESVVVSLFTVILSVFLQIILLS